jgi:hypothetical protein
MATINDGGPAFPRIDVEHFEAGYGHGPHCETQNLPGMTLRDYFAAQAMNGYLQARNDCSSNPDKCAAWAYEQADAMLKARAATSRRSDETIA